MTESFDKRMLRARILMAAIGARRGAAVVLFVVAVIAIAAAAIGPMFIQSADTSVFSSTASASPIGESDLVVISAGGAAKLSSLSAAAHEAHHLADGHLSPTIFTAVAASFFDIKKQSFESDILSRTDICAHLHFVKGGCPTRAGDVAISQRSAAQSGVALGTRLSITEPRSQSTTEVTVTAIYVQPSTDNDTYWRGNFYFDDGTGVPPQVILDPLIGTFDTIFTIRGVVPQLTADLAWHAGALREGAVAIQSSAQRIKSRLFSRDDLTVTTGLSSIITTSLRDDNSMNVIVLAIVLQLILLALVIQYTFGRSTILSRRQESEFARRHGFTRTSLIALVISEPAALIVAALPVGILVAWGALVVITKTLFAPGTPTLFPPIAIALAVGACVAGVCALMVASFDLWRTRAATGRLARRAGVIVDTLAVALALTGALSLLSKGSLSGAKTNPVALLAPGFLTLGAGVIGLRLVQIAISTLIARTKGSTRVAWFLALRQVGRRPLVLRRILPLVAATAILLFAVGSFFLALSNRSVVAHLEVGAAKVVDVTLPPGLNLETAVRRADPSGREAMAAEYYPSSSGGVLAVDSSRFAQVAVWPTSLSNETVAQLAKRLAPPLPPGVSFSGSELRLTLDVAKNTPQIVLEVNLFDETYPRSRTLYLELVGGVHTYTSSLVGVCPGVCRLLNLAPNWVNPANDYSKDVSFIVQGISVKNGAQWHEVSFGAGKRGAWRATPSPVRVEPPASGSVAFDIPGDQLPYGGLLLKPIDLPERIPVIATNGAEVTDAPPTPSPERNIGLNVGGSSFSAHPIAVVSTLPFVGSGGVLVDLGVAERAVTSGASGEVFQVWLAPSASPTILARLRQDGVVTGSISSASARLGALDHGGIALAYAVALIASPIAALLAIGSVMFIIVSDGRRRRREFAALSAAGVPRRLVKRAYVLENAMVLGAAVVLGSVIGFASGTLALSSLPQFVAGSGGFPFSRDVPIVPDLCAAGILALLLAGAVELSTRLVMRERWTLGDSGSGE